MSCLVKGTSDEGSHRSLRSPMCGSTEPQPRLRFGSSHCQEAQSPGLGHSLWNSEGNRANCWMLAGPVNSPTWVSVFHLEHGDDRSSLRLEESSLKLERTPVSVKRLWGPCDGTFQLPMKATNAI